MSGSAREVALEVLTACRKADAWVDGALKSATKRAGLDSRDAALAARITYGVVQNRTLLDARIALYCKNGRCDLEPVILDILRIGACQILLLDRIPPSAAVNEAVEMAKRHHRPRAAGLVNAVLRNLQRDRDHLPEITDLSVRYSHPRWLVDTYVDLLGRGEAEELMALQNRPVATSIQRNPLRCTRAELEAALPQAVPHPWLPDCYELTGAGDLEQLPAFQEGWFLVQDAGAKLVSLAAGCRRGDFILDLCAAPGGKSFAAAMAMGDQGEIHACDIHPHKLALVEKGAARLGVTCLTTHLADGRQRQEAWLNRADVVICDVPCSGLGIIRKKPDIREKDPGALGGLPAVQLAILQNAGSYVRPGGVLLYSTCTILPRENGEVAAAFLREHPEFRLEPFALPGPVGETDGDVTLWPHRHGTDGFYICKLRKSND